MHKHFKQGRAWIELDMQALEHNVAVLSSRLPEGCELMPAVKANAYGHGAALISKALNKLGVQSFCVATAQEGAELRHQGVRGLILVLGYTHPEQFSLLDYYDLTQTVVDFDYAQLLSAYGTPLKVHIGIDTGMHRLGERYDDIERICEMLRAENLCVDGIYTHLCVSDTPDKADRDYTLAQGKAFWSLVAELRSRGFCIPKAHLLGSYGLLNYPELGGNYARVGIALYGVLSDASDKEHCPCDLRPVLSLKSRVSSVRQLYKGERAGYGLCYTAQEERKIAAASIGYADGLPRALSCAVGNVLINGCKAPIVGRICMDQLLVDVTGVTDIQSGDVITIIGASGDESITVYDIASEAHTITNEVLSRLGARLERIVR